MDEQIIEVHVAEDVSVPLAPELVEEAMRWVLANEGIAGAELSCALVGDDQIAELNEQYLSHVGPTDVISFPLAAPGEPPLGDIYIGAEQARRQAAELGVPLGEELLRLAIHGTLHVLGYDHPEGPERDACPMYRRQEELLRGFLERGTLAS